MNLHEDDDLTRAEWDWLLRFLDRLLGLGDHERPVLSAEDRATAAAISTKLRTE